MRKKIALILMFAFVGACASDETSRNESPQSAAEAFLSLMDQGKYRQSWVEASEWVRNHVDAEQWANHVENFRRPLGAIDRREMNSVKFRDSLEDMPNGNYAFVTFDSSREEGRSATELVVLMLESDSTWRVIGYQIL